MGVPGRPKGSTTKPQFKDYVTDEQRTRFVSWAMRAYSKSPRLATWIGDQMFGKAAQPVTGADGGALKVEISEAIAKKNATHPSAKQGS